MKQQQELKERLDQLAVARTGQTTGAVLELANDFTHAEQTIDGRDIAVIKYSPQTPHDAGILPRRKGELWVQIAEGTTDKLLRMWVGIAVTGSEAKWEEVAGRTANAAILDAPNNFTEPEQKINSSQIVTVKKFITEFPTSSPEFEGQFAVCRSDPGDFLKLYIAYTGEEGILTWTSVTTEELSDTVAMTDQVNNFTEYSQTLDGNQILSFINGGEHDPEASGIAPQHDGQLYIAFKTFESGRRDIAVWVANRNTWCPLMIDAAGLAKLREHNEFLGSNSFKDIRQYIGPLEESRRIAAVRRIVGPNNPIVTPDLAPRMAGEFLIWEKEGTTPQEIYVFISVSGSTSGDLVPTAAWRMIWNSKGGSADLSNLAKLDFQNIFTVPQHIGEEGRINATFTTGRHGIRDPMNDESLNLVPFVAGDTYVREFNDAGAIEHQVWTAASAGDADSWLLTFDSRESTTALATQITEVDERLDAFKLSVGDDFAGYDTTIGALDNDITALEGTVNALNTTVNAIPDSLEALETAIDQNRGRIDAIETALTPALKALPETVAGHTTSIANHESRISAYEEIYGTHLATLPSRMNEAERDLMDVETLAGSHTTRLNGHTEAIDTVVENVAAQSSKIAQHTLDLEDQLVKINTNDALIEINREAIEALKTHGYSLDADGNVTGSLFEGHHARITNLEAQPDLPVINEFSAKKYMIVNETGDGLQLSNETTDDVQELATFALGAQTGDALVNIKATGGQTRITSAGMEQDATSAGNTLILNPLAGFNRSIKMPNIADHDVSPLPANHIREGMVMTVLNRGTGQARLEAQGSDRIDNNGEVGQYFQMESKQGVLLFPARYDAGEHRSQFIIMAKFKIDAFPDAGGSSYDDTAVRALIATNTTDITDHETRIGAIEAFGEHPELPEMAGNEGKLLAIADDGSSYVASEFTQDAAATMMVFGTGCQTGSALINQKCSGADTALTSEEVTQTYFCTGNVIMCTPANGTTQVVNMGNIAPYQSTVLTATQVREGGPIKVVNLGAGSLRLEPPSGTFIQDGTTGNALSYNIGGRRTVEFFPAIFDDGTARYIAISNIPNWIPV